MNQDNNANWQYKPDGQEPAEAPNDGVSGPEAPAGDSQSSPSISWTASEYVEHYHGPGWYLTLAGGTIAAAAVIYLITREYFAVVVTAIMGVIVGAYAGRKPRQVTYAVTNSGLKIDDKLYRYNQFKSFAVIKEGSFSSINLLPLKRFMSPISAYFANEDEEQIVSAIGERLPYEERKVDRMDRLTSRLRF